jgi:hypothetical protein
MAMAGSNRSSGIDGSYVVLVPHWVDEIDLDQKITARFQFAQNAALRARTNQLASWMFALG